MLVLLPSPVVPLFYAIAVSAGRGQLSQKLYFSAFIWLRALDDRKFSYPEQGNTSGTGRSTAANKKP